MLPLALDGNGAAGGWGVYWKAWQWNAMVWGSVGFVYVGAAMRISFLCGCGLGLRGDGDECVVPNGDARSMGEARAGSQGRAQLKQE